MAHRPGELPQKLSSKRCDRAIDALCKIIGVLTDVEAGPLPVLVPLAALAGVAALIVAAHALETARVARRGVRALIDVWEEDNCSGLSMFYKGHLYFLTRPCPSFLPREGRNPRGLHVAFL